MYKSLQYLVRQHTTHASMSEDEKDRAPGRGPFFVTRPRYLYRSTRLPGIVLNHVVEVSQIMHIILAVCLDVIESGLFTLECRSPGVRINPGFPGPTKKGLTSHGQSVRMQTEFVPHQIVNVLMLNALEDGKLEAMDYGPGPSER